MKYRSIVLSGPIASGTTTAARALAEKFNLEFHYAGDFFRKYMEKHHVPLFEKEKVPDYLDKKIDAELTALAASPQHIIIDAHYIGYFTRDMTHVLKVLLTCDEAERIRRSQGRPKQEQESKETIKKREAGLDAKFRKLYAHENFLDPKFFDIVIDTTFTTPAEVVEMISRKFLSPN